MSAGNSDPPKSPETRFVGPRGQIGPPIKYLVALGRALHETMKSRPIPEIASVLSVDITHAANRPLAAPEITGAGMKISQKIEDTMTGRVPIMALRPDPQVLAEAIQSKDLEIGVNRANPLVAGSHEMILDGTVSLDVADTGSLEIFGRVSLPSSTDFDDPARRRSLLKRRSAKWPRYIDADGNTQFRSPRDIFGFSVGKASGFVEHNLDQVLLLRIDDLEPCGDDCIGSVDIDLREMVLTGQSGAVKGRVTHRHLFPDGKAREMILRAHAIGRTSDHLSTWNYVDAAGVFVQSRSIPEDLQRTQSPEIEVVLPATKRPAKNSLLTPMPVLYTSRDIHQTPLKPKIQFTRESVVRVRMSRGWFDTGKFERVGIVLWPPDISKTKSTDLDANRLKIKDGEDSYRTAKLDGFVDSDLGPGGKYVTRTGADPVRGGPGDQGHFLGIENFPDVVKNAELADQLSARKVGNNSHYRRASYIPRVSMPIDQGAIRLNSDEAEEVLEVGLITYQPRFDPEEEIWFVNVEINPRFATDPFLRLGVVRYQPNTKEELKVSNPEIQWVQLLPKRTISAEMSEDNKKLLVSVKGQSSIGIKEVGYGNDANAAAFAAPVMKATLMVEGPGPGKSNTRETIPIAEDVYELWVPVREDHGVSNWEFEINKDRFEQPGFQGQFSLFVEEIEMRRPATYEEEPVSIENLETNDPFVPSGPRYSVNIELNVLLESVN